MEVTVEAVPGGVLPWGSMGKIFSDSYQTDFSCILGMTTRNSLSLQNIHVTYSIKISNASESEHQSKKTISELTFHKYFYTKVGTS